MITTAPRARREHVTDRVCEGSIREAAHFTFALLRETITVGSRVVVCSITHQRFIRRVSAVIVIVGPNPISWGSGTVSRTFEAINLPQIVVPVGMLVSDASFEVYARHRNAVFREQPWQLVPVESDAGSSSYQHTNPGQGCVGDEWLQ